MTSSDSAEATASFPANAVEEALDRALSTEGADEGAAEAFLAAMAQGSLWVPVPEGSGTQQDGTIALPSLELQGQVYVPVFTSQEQYDERSSEVPCAVLPVRDLASVLPEGVGLAVNPGNGPSVPLAPETVAGLAGE
ncbi:SseB family protein [Nocardiopsis baichengensis]|uniref:SseB family protein n=1 Tax=Nocardiopsis baichengensis TaxID=280240 RepID=UPI000346028B|nr:SseB family protein [Nocardiopsis baichengensis]